MEKRASYIVVGNGFAGTGCAQQLRALAPDAEITLFGREPYPLYNRLSLPPFLRGEIGAEKLIIRDIAWHEDKNIRLCLNQSVDAIHPEGNVIVSDGKELRYDAMLLATGGKANEIHATGNGDARRFQTLDDAIQIDEEIKNTDVAVAIGGSFIGYELAEAFARRGAKARWVVRGPRVFHKFLDDEAAEMVMTAANADGVEVYCERSVAELRAGKDSRKIVTLDNGEEIEAECVAVGIGLSVNIELAEGTQIKINDGFVCDEFLETDEPGIFVAGDCANILDPLLGMRYRTGTWNSAGAQGRLAATNMIGKREAIANIPEYSTKLFTTQKMLQFGLSPAISPDLDEVKSVDQQNQNYRSLYFKDDRLVGGLLLGNDQGGRRKYLQAIMEKEKFSHSERQDCLEWRA